jgi:Xaa-Pro aminopeptidase
MHSEKRPSFDTIAASGPNAALPHAGVSDRQIEEGDLLVMDFGAVWQGYCSDLTRTVVVGRATDRVREIYRVVLDAQARALKGLRAGMSGKEGDALARDHIDAMGYGEYFGHSLGHGVGVEVHEAPRLSQREEEPLKAGSVVTVEPGIYIPGWGGVRIEDMAVVERAGCRGLTRSRKELLEVGTAQ